MRYAETDFLLALIKEDDWLSAPAEEYYRKHGEELWTSPHTLVELMLVAYREERNVERVVANAAALVDVRGETDPVLAAANVVEEDGLTPFDALHLVAADGDPIVSSDGSYDDVTDRVALEDLTE
ncbi:type II toxin-antitoxin system VapC family toxin [Halobaculum magnesiiphilum]|uniref:PIN domain-containing protein n=1 Tax=Halobaculum magnesiiphilum TaxID=1017351 RepID=A0A8T8W9Y4_9EURY|nr:PIN domain-containing protein [Halobaculum magnesiiphilum]QZP36638.1 PIN domain-containing protein [Halobaculum magnesiiphilum]